MFEAYPNAEGHLPRGAFEGAAHRSTEGPDPRRQGVQRLIE